MPPDNALEVEALQSCYLSSLVLAVNDRESKGELHLPALTSLFSNPQIARQCPPLTSSNYSTRHLAERLLVVEDKAERRKSKPGAVVRKAVADDPGRTEKVLHTAA